MRTDSIKPQTLAIFVALALIAFVVPQTLPVLAGSGGQNDPWTVVGLVLSIGGALVYCLARPHRPTPRLVRVRHGTRYPRA